jgi:hypothetical protein
MRGRGRDKKRQVATSRIPGESTEFREEVERRWYARMEREPELARVVTAKANRREPFHRWLVFKQAYAPELVRDFLRIAEPTPPLLDPFSGTGTLVTECARRDVPAIGVEPVASLGFVTRCKFETSFPPLPTIDWSGAADVAEPWLAAAEQLTEPAHRAALICAVASRLTGEGRVNANARPLEACFREACETVAEDFVRPTPRANLVVRADARRLSFLPDASIGGILTSPPYLSRHDYSKLSAAHEAVYAHWRLRHVNERHGVESGPVAGELVPSHGRAKVAPNTNDRGGGRSESKAVREAVEALNLVGKRRVGRVVRAYFRDMHGVLSEIRRVLMPGGVCWMVIGGARLHDVYVPTDTLLADDAERLGLRVERIVVARDLIPSGRHFGQLVNVAPRESVLVLRNA